MPDLENQGICQISSQEKCGKETKGDATTGVKRKQVETAMSEKGSSSVAHISPEARKKTKNSAEDKQQKIPNGTMWALFWIDIVKCFH